MTQGVSHIRENSCVLSAPSVIEILSLAQRRPLTFIIDWPILILIGLIFGYGVKGTPRGSLFMTRAFITGKMITALFVVIVYYSYLLAPDWMWMYYVRASDLPSWMVWYVLVLYFFAYAIGFCLTVEGAKVARAYPPFLILLMLAAEGVLIWALLDRYIVVGTIEQFLAGTGTALADSVVGGTPTILTVLLIPLSLAFIYWSRRQRFA